LTLRAARSFAAAAEIAQSNCNGARPSPHRSSPVLPRERSLLAAAASLEQAVYYRWLADPTL